MKAKDLWVCLKCSEVFEPMPEKGKPLDWSCPACKADGYFVSRLDGFMDRSKMAEVFQYKEKGFRERAV